MIIEYVKVILCPVFHIDGNIVSKREHAERSLQKRKLRVSGAKTERGGFLGGGKIPRCLMMSRMIRLIPEFPCAHASFEVRSKRFCKTV